MFSQWVRVVEVANTMRDRGELDPNVDFALRCEVAKWLSVVELDTRVDETTKLLAAPVEVAA